MIKKVPRRSKYFAPQNEDIKHICDYPGCHKAGEYRAPKNKKLKDYYWFCLEHVQAYNAKWNYYADEIPDAEETEERRQKFRFSSHIKYNFGFDFDGGYRIFDEAVYQAASSNIRLTPEERKGLAFMEVEIEALDSESLKKAYKKAVKKYHPDVNNNDSTAEEKFKIISTTYKSLLKKLS